MPFSEMRRIYLDYKFDSSSSRDDHSKLTYIAAACKCIRTYVDHACTYDRLHAWKRAYRARPYVRSASWTNLCSYCVVVIYFMVTSHILTIFAKNITFVIIIVFLLLSLVFLPKIMCRCRSTYTHTYIYVYIQQY